jgi:putative transposase
MRFAFIARHRSIWPVAWLCDALDVSRSGFHAWLTRSPSQRSLDDEVVGAKVYASFRPATAPMVPAVSGAMSWLTASRAACTGSSV